MIRIFESVLGGFFEVFSSDVKGTTKGIVKSTIQVTYIIF